MRVHPSGLGDNPRGLFQNVRFVSLGEIRRFRVGMYEVMNRPGGGPPCVDPE